MSIFNTYNNVHNQKNKITLKCFKFSLYKQEVFISKKALKFKSIVFFKKAKKICNLSILKTVIDFF